MFRIFIGALKKEKFIMTDEKILLTREGLDKIKLEYDELVSIRRAEVADKIREARSYGDLSENAK